jgi:hypothetical protein
MALILLVGFLGIAVIGWGWYYHSETRRDLALDQLARRLGMNFRFGLPADLREVLPRFREMERARDANGDFQAGVNSITGLWNRRKIAFFDYHWIAVQAWRTNRPWWRFSDTGDTYRTTHRRSAVAIEIGVAVQPVLIRPERLVDKALALVGYEDIDFDFLPEFSDRFYVNSPDPAAARRLVTPTLARFFMDHIRLSVDFVGPWILLTPDSHLAPRQVQDLMELAGRLGELVTREQSSHSR